MQFDNKNASIEGRKHPRLIADIRLESEQLLVVEPSGADGADPGSATADTPMIDERLQ